MAESTASNQVLEKGRLLLKEGRVRIEINTDKRAHFAVKGETGDHSVIFDKTKKAWSCDCQFSTMKGRECSHIHACKLIMSKMSEH